MINVDDENRPDTVLLYPENVLRDEWERRQSYARCASRIRDCSSIQKINQCANVT